VVVGAAAASERPHVISPQPFGAIMVHINLILWLAMLGAVLGPAPDHVGKWTAVAGLVVAALWEHSAVRGFLKPKKDTLDPITAR
jgi:hypothetical protein